MCKAIKYIATDTKPNWTELNEVINGNTTTNRREEEPSLANSHHTWNVHMKWQCVRMNWHEYPRWIDQMGEKGMHSEKQPTDRCKYSNSEYCIMNKKYCVKRTRQYMLCHEWKTLLRLIEFYFSIFYSGCVLSLEKIILYAPCRLTFFFSFRLNNYSDWKNKHVSAMHALNTTFQMTRN